MASEISCEKPEQRCASPGSWAPRRRSFSRKSFPQTEKSENLVQNDSDSSSALVDSIFRAANHALAAVSNELDFTPDEAALMKAKVHATEKFLGTRGGPLEGACRSLVALQEGLCPPKRLKTESNEDFFTRTLQQTLMDWDLSSVQQLLSKKTDFEPLPPIEEPTDASFHTEDILELQLQNTEQLLAEEATFDKLMQIAAADHVRTLADNRCITARKLMEMFSLYKIGANS